MTAPDPRLEEIAGLAEFLSCIDSERIGEYGRAADAIAYLLAELRKAQDALARVSVVAGSLEARASMNERNIAAGLYDEAMELAADAASSLAREAAAQLRAAVADATGGGE